MSKQYTIAFLVFMVLFSFASTNRLKNPQEEVCPDLEYRPSSFASGLIASLNKLDTDKRRVFLDAEFKKSTLYISSSDAVKILNQVKLNLI